MSKLVKPDGVNFSCAEDVPADKLSNILRETVSFIRQIEPSAKLERYDDWWEHDGLHFHRGSIKIEELSGIVDSPKLLFEAMPGDFEVFVGIAPENNSWYLRFYLDSDENDENLIGRFDITFAGATAEIFQKEILERFDLEMRKRDAQIYYQSIIL